MLRGSLYKQLNLRRSWATKMSQQHPTRYLRRSTPVVPSGLRVVPAPSTRPRPKNPRNKFEAAALKIPEFLKLPDGFFPTDAEIDAELDEIDALIEEESGKKRSYQPYRREDRRARYHQSWDAIFTAANRDTMQIWGVRRSLTLKFLMILT